MKKILSILALFVVLTCSVFAESSLTPPKDPKKWSDMTYTNIPVLKVLEARDGYLVIYQKNRIGVGTTVIPKEWARGNPENPRKLQMRFAQFQNYSYMTVVKKNGEFHRVILTLPKTKACSVWGVYNHGTKLEGADKDTLEELDLY